MSVSKEWTIYTDGAARANPGPAAYAFVIRRPGQPDIEGKGCLGETTNNIAEYTALVRALERARELGGKRLVIKSDSELMVKQMNGEYKVRHAGLVPLYRRAEGLCSDFESVTIRHVPREENRRADVLCNEALDGIHKAAAPKPRGRKHGTAEEKIRTAALALLEASARAWAKGDPKDPDPEMIWDSLWDLISSEEA
jgi:ribonuclease HI